MARVISIINNKGGTGKTTTTINLGAALAAKRKRVLLLDMDSQCNLSSALGVANAEQHAGLLCDRENVDSTLYAIAAYLRAAAQQ